MKNKKTEETTDVVEDEAVAEPQTVVIAGPPAAMRTAEAWALAKGYLPQLIQHSTPFARAGAPASFAPNPQHWKFAGASASWPEGKEMTEAEFDAEITRATTETFR